jgi:hypothetical protein
MRTVSLATSFGILALAATTAFAAPAKKEAWASGHIGRVDAAARSVVVKQGTHEMTFALATDATLTQGATTIQLTDLAADAGKPVKVRYSLNGTTRVADRVEVGAAKPMTGGKAAAHKG